MLIKRFEEAHHPLPEVGEKMRQLLTVLFCAGFASAASAGIKLYDPFDYPVGAPDEVSTADGAGGWLKMNVSDTPAPKMQSNSLSYPGLSWAPSGNSAILDGRASPSPAPASSVTREITPGRMSGTTTLRPGYNVSDHVVMYYSVLFRVPSVTGLATSVNGSFIGGFRSHPGTDAHQVAQVGAPLLIRAARDAGGNLVSGKFQLGTGLTAGDANRRWATDHYLPVFDAAGDPAGGDTMLLVFAYQLHSGDNVARMWVNPDPNSSTAPTPTLEVPFESGMTTIQNGQISNVFLRNNSVAPNDVIMDELRVATSWAGVMSIPEPASLSLLALASLALARRRRAC